MKTKFLLSIAAFCTLFVFSCGPTPDVNGAFQDDIYTEDEAIDSNEYAEYEEGAPNEDGSQITFQKIVSNEHPKPLNPENYEARLKVKETIYAHRSGDMEVWIGHHKYKKAVNEGYKYDSILIPSNRGEYVLITPVAPEFTVVPEISKCLKLDSTGISEKFILTPKKGTHGKVDVSAKIELFENCNCTGTSIQKTSDTYTVTVKISIVSLLYQMWDIIWDNFIAFFGTLVALLFTIIIIKIRKKSGVDNKA